jgi:hypothetical protein
MPLYQDDDDIDPVSDFQQVKDATDTDAAAPPEDDSQTRLKAMMTVRKTVRVSLWSPSLWLIFISQLAEEHVLHENEVLATETLHFLSLMDIQGMDLGKPRMMDS